jgi:hypothetical protein
LQAKRDIRISSPKNFEDSLALARYGAMEANFEGRDVDVTKVLRLLGLDGVNLQSQFSEKGCFPA